MYASTMIAVNAIMALWAAPAIWWADFYYQHTGDRSGLRAVSHSIDAASRTVSNVTRLR